MSTYLRLWRTLFNPEDTYKNLKFSNSRLCHRFRDSRGEASKDGDDGEETHIARFLTVEFQKVVGSQTDRDWAWGHPHYIL